MIKDIFGYLFGTKRRYTVLFCLMLVGVYCLAHIGASKINNSIPAFIETGPDSALPIIVIDAGHGGIDGGCSSASGIPEKGINLNILLCLRDMLVASGYEVAVTRDSDISIHDKGIEGIANQKASDMDNRLALFNKYNNAICLSIHQNQYVTEQARGAQMFYSLTNDENAVLAQIMQDSFASLLQPENEREIKPCKEELFLCHFCDNPTVMVECGFLSNPDDAALLTDEEYQRKAAFTIYCGLCNFIAQR